MTRFTPKTYLLIPGLLSLALLGPLVRADQVDTSTPASSPASSLEVEIPSPPATETPAISTPTPEQINLTEAPQAEAATSVTETTLPTTEATPMDTESSQPELVSEKSQSLETSPSDTGDKVDIAPDLTTGQSKENTEPVATQETPVETDQDRQVTETAPATDPELEKGPSSGGTAFRTRSADGLAPSGTYHFSGPAGIKAEPKLTSPDLATYTAGQSVNYDQLVEGDGHRWISYVAFSGHRRYIAVEALKSASSLTGTGSRTEVTAAELTARGIELAYIGDQVRDKSKVLFAIWSDTKGQDDLKWYNADAQGKATASYSNHSHYGTYHVHTYSTETGQTVGLKSQTITIARPSMTSAIRQINDSTVEITVTTPHYMNGVKIPVWSEKGGQDDLKWYNATAQGNSSYKLTVDATKHKSDLGKYLAHVYGKSQLEENRTVGLGTTAGFEVKRIVQPASQYTSPNGRPQYQANTYPTGQCTWGAKQVAPWVNNYWGNAGDWVESAKRDGFTVGTKPVVGAVAVWPNVYYKGYRYGHVGVVTEVVNDNLIRTLESNVNDDMTLRDHRGLFNPKDPTYLGGVVSYIYPPGK